MTTIFPYTTKQDWLNLKKEDISSTESPALFGLSPYMTEFELYHLKASGTIMEIDESERMKWGKRLESAIAEGVAADLGLIVEPFKDYLRHPTVKGMGSSFDYAIESHEDGPGLMEIKNVDSLVYRNTWSDTEAPAHIETQMQHQLEVADRDWGLIVALCGGNTPKILRRKRDREVGRIICQRVEKFWRDVAASNAPKPDYTRDADFIISLHQSAGVNVLEPVEPELSDLIAEYDHIRTEASSYEELKKVKQAEILEIVGDDYNKVVTSNGYTLSCGMVKDTPSTVITADMVGQEIGGRKGYRMFKLHKKKEAANGK